MSAAVQLSPYLVTEAMLKKTTGCEQRAALERRLRVCLRGFCCFGFFGLAV